MISASRLYRKLKRNISDTWHRVDECQGRIDSLRQWCYDNCTDERSDGHAWSLDEKLGMYHMVYVRRRNDQIAFMLTWKDNQ